MGNELLASKIVIQEDEPEFRVIEGVATAVTAIPGICERGPVGVPTLCTSPQDFARVFGGYIRGSYTPQAVDGFFDNGGGQIYVIRVVHHTDPRDPLTKTSAKASATAQTAPVAPAPAILSSSLTAPFNVTPGATLQIAVDGAAPVTATFLATEAVQASAAEPFDLHTLPAITLKVNGGAAQTVTPLAGEFVDASIATAAEVAAVINARVTGIRASVANGTVVLRTDLAGSAASLEVVSSAGATALGLTVGIATGSGNVANASAVTSLEVKSVVESAVSALSVDVLAGLKLRSKTSGTSSSVHVQAASTAAGALGLSTALVTGSNTSTFGTVVFEAKYDGAYGNELSVQVVPASSLDPERFNLLVLRNGLTVEIHSNLTLDIDDPSYVVDILDRDSYLVSAVVQAHSGSLLERRPANAVIGPFVGGLDGLTGLDDNDFIGGVGANGRTGLRTLDSVQDDAILICPDRATPAVQNAMITYSELRGRSIFCVLDPPALLGAVEIVQYVKQIAQFQNTSEMGAFYWPRVKVDNPNRSVFGKTDTMVMPPSGHIAGMMARTDAAQAGGVYNAPAGTTVGTLRGVRGFEVDETLEEDKRDLVYPERINPITSMPGVAPFVDGCRTLKAGGNFPSVPERRGVTFIEQSIKKALQSARHRNNTERLRAQVERVTTIFLNEQMRAEAFRSKDPKTAYYIDISAALNPPSAVFKGQLTMKVGLATNKPAEFIVLRFTQDVRALSNG